MTFAAQEKTIARIKNNLHHIIHTANKIGIQRISYEMRYALDHYWLHDEITPSKTKQFEKGDL